MAGLIMEWFGCAQDPKAGVLAVDADLGVLEGWEALELKMQKKGCSDAAIKAFKANYDKLVSGSDTGTIAEEEIDCVTSLPTLEEKRGSSARVNLTTLLSKTAVIKLNGGLGTSMGLEKAKSLLEVKAGTTFLDLIVGQVMHLRKRFGSEVRFILMDSFSTTSDTMDFIKDRYPDLAEEAGIELMQNVSPKVNAETLGPVYWPKKRDLEWCPPGHGDLYASLLGTGLLDKLLSEGVKYVFVSNSDNLGATLDIDILAYFASSGLDFLMEAATRRESDKKGGHLAIRRKDGKFILRESAMVEEKDVESFQDVSKHCFFNTNNIWVNLESLKTLMEANDGVVPLPLIKNKKSVDPRDASSTRVLQLETAMGSAIGSFEKAGAIAVPRNRFTPVKTCSDLFVIRSDAYRVSQDKRVVLASQMPPVAKLGDDYKLVDELDELVSDTPSLIGCIQLDIVGRVAIRPNTVFQGKCKLVNKSGRQQILPAGEYMNYQKIW